MTPPFQGGDRGFKSRWGYRVAEAGLHFRAAVHAHDIRWWCEHMFVKPTEHAAARRLRREGHSVKRIAAALGVSVSSVSRWTRDIVLSQEQLNALREADPVRSRSRVGVESQRRAARAARRAAQQHGRELARQPTALHQQGCMLFWAEGRKKRNTLQFTNSDPDMMALFIRFLRVSYEVPDHRIAFSVSCFLNSGLTLAEIEAWCLGRVGLPPTCLRGASVNRPSKASRWRRNVLVYGTAQVAVHSTFITQSIFGAIQEYVGIDRPEWLDCLPSDGRGRDVA